MTKSAAWIANRLTGIGGSDATIIMSGDMDAIFSLWEVKLGLCESENLDWVLPVQMGSVTEDLNCRFLAHTTGRAVTDRNKDFRSKSHPWMRSEVDGMTTLKSGEPAIVECKHVNAFTKIEDAQMKYTAQMHHNMFVRGVEAAVFSVFIGTLKHEIVEVRLDDAMMIPILEAEDHFWKCVQDKKAPRISEKLDVAITTARREVDMTKSNSWAVASIEWLEHREAGKAFERSVKAIKELLEPDVARAFGCGIQAKRAKNGAITITEVK